MSYTIYQMQDWCLYNNNVSKWLLNQADIKNNKAYFVVKNNNSGYNFTFITSNKIDCEKIDSHKIGIYSIAVSDCYNNKFIVDAVFIPEVVYKMQKIDK